MKSLKIYEAICCFKYLFSKISTIDVLYPY